MMKVTALLVVLGLFVGQGSGFFPIPLPFAIPSFTEFLQLRDALFEPGIKLFDVTVTDAGLTKLVTDAAITFIGQKTNIQLPRPKVLSVRAEVRIALAKQISVEVGLMYEQVPKPDGTVEDDTCYVRITHGYNSPIACYIEKFVCNGIVGSFPPFKK